LSSSPTALFYLVQIPPKILIVAFVLIVLPDGPSKSVQQFAFLGRYNEYYPAVAKNCVLKI
jgi:hypothetical protein